MKKTLLIVCLICSLSFSQEKDLKNFDSNYNILIEHLTKEDWNKSEKLSKVLLLLAEPVDSLAGEAKILRYMYLYSTAGLLSEKKISKEEAYDKVKFLKSKEMILASHPFKSNCYVNCTHLNDEDPNAFFTCVNNSNGTQILSFENVKIEEGIKETKSELEGKFILLKAVLNEISVEGFALPRFKLNFIKGEYIVRSE